MADRLQYQFDFLQGKNDVTKTVASIQTGISSIASTALKATIGVGAIVLGVRGLASAFSKSVSEAINQEEAINEINTALALTGKYSESASKSMQDFASSIQSVTTFGDDVILKTSALLQNLAMLDVQGLQRATKASLDLASALKIDVETAATMVGKAAQGNISTFQRYGLTIQKGASDAETFANTLKILEERFGGFSEAAMNTFGGALQSVRNVFGDVLERVGNLIIKNPAVIKLFQVLKGVLIELEKTLGANQDAMIKLIQNGIVILIDALSLTLKALIPVVSVLGVLGSVALMSGRGILQLIQTLSEFEIIKKIINSFAAGFVAAFGLVTKTLGLVINGWMELINLIPMASDELKKFGLDTKGVIKTIDNLNNSIDEVTNNLMDNKYDMSGFLADTEKDYKNFEEGYKNSLLSVIKSLEIAGINTEKLAEQIKGLKITATPVIANVQEDIKSVFDKISDSIKDLKIQALTAWTSGKSGAIKLAGSLATAISTEFLGPIGQAAGPIIEAFAQGPDYVKAMFTEFINSIPEIVKNIIQSIPVIIQALADRMPDVVDALIVELSNPELWVKVNYAMIKGINLLIPRLAEGIVKGLRDSLNTIIKQIGEGLSSEFVKSAASFTTEIVKGAGKFVEEIIKKVGGGVTGGISSAGGILGNVVSSIGGVFGFAEGGMVKSVPTGFNNDTFPARLSSGELIVDYDTTNKLKSFLDNQDNSLTSALLNAILNELRNPMTVQTSVQLNNQTLADIILNLNRNNARLA